MLATWMTKTISGHAIIPAQLEKEQAESVRHSIALLGYDKFDRLMAEEIVDQPQVTENKEGSYEKLMMLMGSAGTIM